MFNKLLVANRGEIAVRIVRTCREMGIKTVAIYERADIGSLHVRLADECALLDHIDGLYALDRIVQIAQEHGADAIHPGFGFLADQPNFGSACEAAGIRLVGPPPETLRLTQDKLGVLHTARRRGFPTVQFAPDYFNPDDDDAEPQALYAAAQELGYPIVLKPRCSGSGKGEWVAHDDDALAAAFRHAAATGDAAFCDPRVYLEKAVYPARKISVHILGHPAKNVIVLGESQMTLYPRNLRIIEETPAPGLTASQRKDLAHLSQELAQVFAVSSAGTIEYLIDEDGDFYLTEIKARLPVGHPAIEMTTRLDLVREQIRIACGLPLELGCSRVRAGGVAMTCRINVEDPEHDFLPSPGLLRQVRLPGGGEVRVDTYVYAGCEAPVLYDPLIATITVWGPDRNACLKRMRRALHECEFFGVNTNLKLLKEIFAQPEFADGRCVITARAKGTELQPNGNGTLHCRDLAVIAGLLHEHRTHLAAPGLARLQRFNRRWKDDGQKAPPDMPFLRFKSR